MLIKLISFQTTVIVAMAVVSLTACDPTRLPGLNQSAKQQEERITKETEEAIKKSPKLQELDRLCTDQTPRPVNTVLVKKFRDLQGEKFVGYAYISKSNYQTVNRFYTNYLTERGWRQTYQTNAAWGPSEVEFQKGDYKIKLSEGMKEITYFLQCGKQ